MIGAVAVGWICGALVTLAKGAAPGLRSGWQAHSIPARQVIVANNTEAFILFPPSPSRRIYSGG
jgi:hypothetical protein